MQIIGSRNSDSPTVDHWMLQKQAVKKDERGCGLFDNVYIRPEAYRVTGWIDFGGDG